MQRVELAHGSEHVVSPTSVLNIVHMRTANQGDNCTDMTCTLTTTFRWLREGSCKATFFCADLEGSPCADYKISVQTDMDDKGSELCFPQVSKVGSVQDEFLIRLWHTRHAQFQMSCYMWCTTDGLMPDSSEEETPFAYDDFMRQMVRLEPCSSS